MPYPLAHGLVGATIIAASKEDFNLKRDSWLMFLAAGLAAVPDLDMILAKGFRLGDAWHRSFTHCILTALVIGLLIALAAGRNHLRTLLTFSLVVISHGLLDTITKTNLGVALLWPFSARRFSLALIKYPTFDFNWAMFHAPWRDTLKGVVKVTLLEALVFGPFFLLVIGLRLRWRSNG